MVVFIIKSSSKLKVEGEEELNIKTQGPFQDCQSQPQMCGVSWVPNLKDLQFQKQWYEWRNEGKDGGREGRKKKQHREDELLKPL